MFFFTTEELHFTPEFLGRARLAGALASLAGVGLYNAKLKAVPIKRIFRTTTLLGCALGLTQLILVTGLNRRYGISDQLFALTDTVLGQVAFMPTLVLAARICPEGVEATLFAALMSVFNAAGVASGALGAALTAALHVGTTAGAPEGTPPDFANLPLLILICNFAGLLPLPFLFLLDEVPGLADAEATKASIDARAGGADTAADVEMTRSTTTSQTSVRV